MAWKRIERRAAGPVVAFPGLHPVLARVYAARGIADATEIDDALGALAHWAALGSIDRAVALLVDALGANQRILVVGDFDADGATSAALTVGVLRAFGATHVDFLVPNRFEYGYGLTPEIVALASEKFSPDLIVTVDNGVSSHAGVDAAHARGIKVLVTDHHLPGRTLPAADAIVNPNLADDGFPSKALAGVGVVFYLLLALRNALGAVGEAVRLADWLDLVAVGTVADVVPLDHNNRILVAQGLKRIRAGRCRPGITALLRAAGRDPARACASDIGFGVAPRLNAAGRLEDMSVGIACLLADDAESAAGLAAQLDTLNVERRDIERQMHEQALDALQRLPAEASAAGVCLYEPGWHQGVVGIVASRVKEKLHRPVIAFARSGPGELKGSGRSIPGFHIRDALDTIAARDPALLQRFGGHAMAAGLSLAERDFDAFARAFDAVAAERLDAAALEQVLWTDGPLDPDELCLELADALRDGGPWGQGFPEPVFDGLFEVVERRVVGQYHLKLRVQPPGLRRVFDAIAFNTPAERLGSGAGHARLVYRLDVNEWRGNRRVQLVVEHLEPA
ncbi:MAG: single-stranded-DNA-specific exonuclease RecJ [Gammaproteobacteria bacterium]